MTIKELISELAYQTAPGIHTYGQGACGHPTRGSRAMCADCIDKVLRSRGVDVTNKSNGSKYERIGGRIERKGKQ